MGATCGLSWLKKDHSVDTPTTETTPGAVESGEGEKEIGVEEEEEASSPRDASL
jgi:hypothetical protein